jgi:hypothetical protein
MNGWVSHTNLLRFFHHTASRLADNIRAKTAADSGFITVAQELIWINRPATTGCYSATLNCQRGDAMAQTAATNQPTGADQRRAKRERVIKRAKIIYGFAGSTIDCHILDESPYGLMIETESMVAIPEQLTVKLEDAGMFHVVRRWALGNKIGLELVGPQIIDEATHLRMQSILEILDRQGIGAAMQILHADRFFDNLDLRHTAETADHAMTELRTFLQSAATTPRLPEVSRQAK